MPSEEEEKKRSFLTMRMDLPFISNPDLKSRKSKVARLHSGKKKGLRKSNLYVIFMKFVSSASASEQRHPRHPRASASKISHIICERQRAKSAHHWRASASPSR
ncbi:MAG: hypothetical protein MJZ70_04240 [Bacteroidales bacterium]|nr:hypothetical protein [Bacteroidales bacterium]